MSAQDDFGSHGEGLAAPAKHAAVVTPADGADLAHASRSLYIGTGGTLKVTTLGGETLTITVGDNMMLPLRVVRVFSTGTTATDILSLY